MCLGAWRVCGLNVESPAMSEIHSKTLILQAARDLYLEAGLLGFSMRKVAAKVDLSATAIYRHYKNREDLLYEVIGEGYRVFSEYLDTTGNGGTALSRFKEQGLGYVDFALEQPGYYRMIFVAPELLGEDGLPEHIQAQARATFEQLRDQVQECIDAEFFHAIAEEMAEIIWAHCHGMVSLYMTKRYWGDMSPEEFRDAFAVAGERMVLAQIAASAHKKALEAKAS